MRCCERFWTAHSWNTLAILSLLLWSNFWAKIRNFIKFHHTSKHLLNKRIIQEQKRWKSSRLKALPRNPKLWEGVAGPVLGISRLPNPRPCLAPGSCWANVCWWPDVLKQLCKVWYLPGISSISHEFIVGVVFRWETPPFLTFAETHQIKALAQACDTSSAHVDDDKDSRCLRSLLLLPLPKGIGTAMDRISAPSMFSWHSQKIND